MKAWRFTAVDAPLALSEVPEPTPSAGEIVIDVKAAGLCHSDVGFLDGTLSSLLPFSPITLGHEIAGVVVAVGEQVTDFAIGDKVGVPAAIEGPGTSLDGGFAEYVRVPARLVVPVPDNVPFEQAAAATDAGLTSYHAVVVRGQVKAGMKVGIIGLGGLGSLGAQTALAQGAQVYVAELNENVHGYARELGVTAVARDITEFQDEELDVVIDFAGYDATTAAAVQTVKTRGRVVLVGLGEALSTISTQAVVLRSLDLVGSQAGTKEDCSAVLDLIAQGALASKITQIGFDEIGEGVERLKQGGVVGRLVAVRS